MVEPGRHGCLGFTDDDFGTGCSGLNALRKFPVNKRMIDRSFIHEIQGYLAARPLPSDQLQARFRQPAEMPWTARGGIMPPHA